ncbi:predicted protein [Nematostella vectensis]|uniref:Rhodanese domain-containing protein n=1 Tax=Nematostella vectensis TaxID=45351 RepID=A7SFT7_NEMVE|nr:predicted protein [Nematostella vectensis]|eukprot:XP_001629470.1 predicted protein [Nematostella vectensis]
MSEPLGLGFRGVVKVIQRLYPHVPRMSTDQLQRILRNTSDQRTNRKPPNLVMLDVREQKERDVSLIDGSIHVKPSTTDMTKLLERVNKLVHPAKDPKTILCYCATGLRASIMADRILTELSKHEDLKQSTRVYALEGSIFKWGNEFKPLVDPNGRKTVQVHGMNSVQRLLLWPQIRV